MRRAHFFVFKVFPPPDSGFFEDHASAVVSAWVSVAKFVEPELARRYAIEKLRIEGWCVAAVVLEQLVTDASYRHKVEGRQEFANALEQGFFANIAMQDRDMVGEWVDALESRRALAGALSRREDVYTLFIGDQYANGVLNNQNEFIPLWPSAELAQPWVERWPEHAMRALATEDVEELCAGAADEGMYIGLGTADGIVMFHPGDILSLVPPPRS